ncbi:MAG: 2-oxo acid dehydrogenase subunit E2, partial [Actinomycetota bacterium]|nr:2-oxo acid dehydrogenase subunit E2 [Actinomycetota bacterium]
MSEIRFPLPDVGEGLTEAEIVQWRVAPGDRIALDQVFVEIETAKSLVELPSAFEGVVAELLVDEGNTVNVGTPILVIQTDAPATDVPGTDVAGANAADANGAGTDAAAPAPATGGGAGANTPGSTAGRPSAATPPSGTAASHAPAVGEGGGAVLVGHGATGPTSTRRKRHPSPGGAHGHLATSGTGASRADAAAA